MRLIKKKVVLNPQAKVNPFSLFINSFFYIGFIPFASGTFASAFSLIIFLIPAFNDLLILCIATTGLFVVSLMMGKSILLKYGEDPSIYVADEVVGMWVTIIIIKIFFADINLLYLFIAFCLFRFFDIIKIQPAKYFDKLNNTFGILMDDVVSGIYSGLFSTLIIYIINLLNK